MVNATPPLSSFKSELDFHFNFRHRVRIYHIVPFYDYWPFNPQPLLHCVTLVCYSTWFSISDGNFPPDRILPFHQILIIAILIIINRISYLLFLGWWVFFFASALFVWLRALPPPKQNIEDKRKFFSFFDARLPCGTSERFFGASSHIKRTNECPPKLSALPPPNETFFSFPSRVALLWRLSLLIQGMLKYHESRSFFSPLCVHLGCVHFNWVTPSLTMTGPQTLLFYKNTPPQDPLFRIYGRNTLFCKSAVIFFH